MKHFGAKFVSNGKTTEKVYVGDECVGRCYKEKKHGAFIGLVAGSCNVVVQSTESKEDLARLLWEGLNG